MNYFYANLNQDICTFAADIITPSLTCPKIFLGTLIYGMKAVSTRYFDLLRYMGYLQYKGVNYDFINSKEFGEISKILNFKITFII